MSRICLFSFSSSSFRVLANFAFLWLQHRYPLCRPRYRIRPGVENICVVMSKQFWTACHDDHYHQMVVLHLRILRVGWSDWWWCIKYDMNDHGISGWPREGYLDHISQAIGGSSHFCQYSLSPPQKIEKNKTISWCVRMSSWNVFLESPFPLKAWFV